MAITITEPEQNASETSPLLSQPNRGGNTDGGGSGTGNGNGNGYVVDLENSQPPATATENAGHDHGVALAEEPSTKKLVAIMAASWIGVFFAALGTYLVKLHSALGRHNPGVVTAAFYACEQ